MKILAIDIGEKTQDILLYDDSITIGNRRRCCSRYEVIRSEGDLFIKGDTIGGRMLSRAIKEHAKNIKFL